MQYAVCHDVKDSVLTKHLETIKVITKSFVDNTSDDYKVCSPYAPFLAWASQFIIFCRYQHQLDKIAIQVLNLKKELVEKNEKHLSIKNIVDSLAKDGLS